MNYLVFKLMAQKSDAVLDKKSIMNAINSLLILEYVDDGTILWDEDDDLIFNPPVGKADKGYWMSVINSRIKALNWEVTSD
jgi:hypothetical protein